MSREPAFSVFTSESVTEGHPDKLADQISDAILDAILAKDPLARVACEAIVTTGLVIVVGEITTDCYVDIPRIIRQTVREVGYTRAKYGYDAETCGVITSIDEQSPDIAQGVDVGGAGDSGMMFGYACNETPEHLAGVGISMFTFEQFHGQPLIIPLEVILQVRRTLVLVGGEVV